MHSFLNVLPLCHSLLPAPAWVVHLAVSTVRSSRSSSGGRRSFPLSPTAFKNKMRSAGNEEHTAKLHAADVAAVQTMPSRGPTSPLTWSERVCVLSVRA